MTMPRSVMAIILLAAGALLLAAPPSEQVRNPSSRPAPVYLVVTRPMFTDALEPLLARRRAEGFDVVVRTGSVAEALAAVGRPAMILLVGDDAGGDSDAPWSLPAGRAPFYRWRATQAEQMPTDALLGDLDGDRVPDVPVGRLPVRSSEQLAGVVAKILAYEDRPPTVDDLTVPLWAGTAGVGAVVDALAEGLVTTTFEDFTPPWVQPWVIFGRADSRFCHWPPLQAAAFQDRCRQGGAMAYLIGHGDRRMFYSMQFQGRTIGYDVATVRKTLAEGSPTGPLVILACYCGDFTGRDDCLAEALLAAPGGPVAVVAATAESHPLPNTLLVRNLTAALDDGHERLGALWLAAARAAYREQAPLLVAALVAAEGALGERVNVTRLRRDHLLLYALLGDPATRLKLPRPLHGRVTRRSDGWHWQVRKPDDAETLHASFRPAVPMPVSHILVDPNELPPGKAGDFVRMHRAANGAYEFWPDEAPTLERRWHGACPLPGILRLVAVGPKNIYAVALHLRRPEPAPSPSSQPAETGTR